METPDKPESIKETSFNNNNTPRGQEKICHICGGISKEIFTNFEFDQCHHIYCVYCLYRVIFQNNINEFIDKREIIIHCKCKKDDKKLSINDINDIITYKSNIDIEKKENNNIKCIIHNSNYDYFCKDCEQYICSSCGSELSHQNHKLVLVTNMVRMYKEYIRGIPIKYRSSEEFKLNLDSSVEKFNKDLAEKTNSVLKGINQLIEDLNYIKKEYISILREIQAKGLESINLMKSFYFEFYHDLTDIDNDNDIFSLRFLAHFNSEMDNFEMKYNMDILNIVEEFQKQTKLLKSLIKNPFSLKVNNKEIPKTFREVIRTLGHEGSINCLKKIGDNQFISGSSDNSIKFWNLDDVEFKPYDCLKKYTGSVGYLLLLKDNRLCSTTTKENWIKIYEKVKTSVEKSENGEKANYKYSISLTLSEHKKPITSLIQLENDLLISASKDENIIIWESIENIFKKFDCIQAHIGGVYSLCQLKDNKFVSGGADGNITLWKNNGINNKYFFYQTINGAHKGKIRCLILLNNNNLCSAGDDGYVKVWKENDNKYEIFWSQEVKNEIFTCLCELKNGFLLTGSNVPKNMGTANLRVWAQNKNGYEEKEIIKKHYKSIKSIIELDWGNIASAGEDGVIIIWKSGFIID